MPETTPTPTRALTTDTRTLGETGITVSALGVGTWAWGDTAFWGYGGTYTRADAAAAFRASLDEGINFFDTAEIYGRGTSERLLGSFAHTIASPDAPLVLASKFAPLPNRWSVKKAIPEMLDQTLARLGVEQLGLYQIHWPVPWAKSDDLMDALAAAVHAGKVRAVGVSNYTGKMMHRAHARLATHGVPLASNQVQYSLLHRAPETNGVLDACRELNVALIAYSPLAQGVLTARYANGEIGKLSGPRRFSRQWSAKGREELRPLTTMLQEIAAAHEKTVEQVALNWLLSIDPRVIPIPGAKRATQATANAGALGWRLTDTELATLAGLTTAHRRSFPPI